MKPSPHEKVYGQVLEDALRKARGANALVNPSSMFRGICMLVRGTPVHVE